MCALEIIKLELLSIKIQKELIDKYSGYDDAVSKIIVRSARGAINQAKESIQFFSTMLK